MEQMKLQELKEKSPKELLSFAEEMNVENAAETGVGPLSDI